MVWAPMAKDKHAGYQKSKTAPCPSTILFSDLQESHGSTKHVWVNNILLTCCLFLILNILQAFF